MPRSPRTRRPGVTTTAHQPTTTGQPLPSLLQWPAAADAPQPHHQLPHQPQPVAPLALHTSSTAQPHQLHPLPPAPPLSAYQHQPHQPPTGYHHHQQPHHQPQQLPQPVESGQRLVCFDRGPSTQLRVNWTTFNGHPFLSLRVWCQLPDGRWVPDGRRGCTVKVRELEGFRDAVQQALDLAADAMGA